MKRMLLVIMYLLLTLSACASPESSSDNDGIGVTITGLHHLGENFSIYEFSVNKQWGGDVGRKGGGGSFVCCAVLPRKWRNDLAVEIRWMVSNWENANTDEIDKENYSSILREGPYMAKVPVEYYEEPGDLFVHFFPNGRVRVISSLYWPRSPQHPIRPGVYESASATAGILIQDARSGGVIGTK